MRRKWRGGRTSISCGQQEDAQPFATDKVFFLSVCKLRRFFCLQAARVVSYKRTFQSCLKFQEDGRNFGKMFEQWKGRSPCAVEGWQSLQETFLLKEGMMEMLIAFSCGLDASDLACFLLYPERTQFDCFRVIDCSN